MNRKIVTAFICAINKHDVEAIAGLMADDHTFIDSHNNHMTGSQSLKAAWQSYFEIFPDYTIEISEIIDGDMCLAVFGFAEGTYCNWHNSEGSNHFRIPAAWKATVDNEKIKLWQVFADSKIPFDIIEKNKKK
jgi:ketosteroid isomerase-like protein